MFNHRVHDLIHALLIHFIKSNNVAYQRFTNNVNLKIIHRYTLKYITFCSHLLPQNIINK
jgi:hypothetical protein